MRTSIVGKILTALIFASVIGGLSAGPALSQNNYRGQGPQQRGWYDDRGWHVYGTYRYRTYRYRPAPVYAPPPVVYVPLPSPGISIFFPSIVIR